MIHYMSAKASPIEPITRAIAQVLSDAVKDQWQKFPSKTDFNVAAAKAAGVNPETIARLLRADTSIRVDYLAKMGELLGMSASTIVAKAEAAVAETAPTDASHSGQSALSGDYPDELEQLVNRAHTDSDAWDASSREQ